MSFTRSGNPAFDYLTWQDHAQSIHERRLADGKRLCASCREYFDGEQMKRLRGEDYCRTCFFDTLGAARRAMRRAAGKAAVVAAAVALMAMPAAAESLVTWKWSAATVAASSAVDAASSWGQREMNPLLGQRFGWPSLAIKAGVVGGSLLAQRIILRRRPDAVRLAAGLNFGMAALHLGVASRNRRGQ